MVGDTMMFWWQEPLKNGQIGQHYLKVVTYESEALVIFGAFWNFAELNMEPNIHHQHR